MAVALLSPGSGRAWDALRARALDPARGDVSRDEAKTWLREGASPAGFPPPTPDEVCARVYGGKAVAALALLESVVRALHVLFSSNSTRTWSPAAVGILAAAATRRCVPIVARAHVDKVTAEAMFGTKAKAE